MGCHFWDEVIERLVSPRVLLAGSFWEKPAAMLWRGPREWAWKHILPQWNHGMTTADTLLEASWEILRQKYPKIYPDSWPTENVGK